MVATTKSLHELTAADLMSQDVFALSVSTPLRDAARMLFDRAVSGAPVVDAAGRVVGVLSAADYLRRAAGRANDSFRAHRPMTCSFQARHRFEDGREKSLCLLSPGVCPIQMRQQGPSDEELLICREPHTVSVDWQIVELERMPTGDVERHMTPDPIIVGPQTPIHALARKMIDAHVRRLIVVDEGHRPVGIVSVTDLLAALAYSDPKACAASEETALP